MVAASISLLNFKLSSASILKIHTTLAASRGRFSGRKYGFTPLPPSSRIRCTSSSATASATKCLNHYGIHLIHNSKRLLWEGMATASDKFTQLRLDTPKDVKTALFATTLTCALLTAISALSHFFVEQIKRTTAGEPNSKVRESAWDAFLLHGHNKDGTVKHEQSVWAALKLPATLLNAFVAITGLFKIFIPDAYGIGDMFKAWKGATIVWSIWFVLRWKNSATTALASHNLTECDPCLWNWKYVEDCTSCMSEIFFLLAACEAFGDEPFIFLIMGVVIVVFLVALGHGFLIKSLEPDWDQPLPICIGELIEAVVKERHERCNQVVARFRIQVGNLDTITPLVRKIPSVLESLPYVFLDDKVPYCGVSVDDQGCLILSVCCNLKIMDKEQTDSAQKQITQQLVNLLVRYDEALVAADLQKRATKMFSLASSFEFWAAVAALISLPNFFFFDDSLSNF